MFVNRALPNIPKDNIIGYIIKNNLLGDVYADSPRFVNIKISKSHR